MTKEENKTTTEEQNQLTEAEKLQADLNEMTNTAKRALADLQNYKSQVTKEKQEMLQIAKFNVLNSFLPVLDSLKLALKQTPENLEDSAFLKGILSIEKQFTNIINQAGLKAIEHETLDPLKHEVIASIPGEKDKIIEIIEQGYTLDDKVLKPSKVVVGGGN